MRILSLDPGSKVGYAAADVDPKTGTWDNVTHGITELWEMAEAVHRAAGRYDVIILEEWRLYPDKAKAMVGSSFPSVQFIGAVKLSARLAGTKVVMQGARIQEATINAMKVLNPELHELVTRPIAHDDGHDQSALTHLFYWTMKHTDIVKEVVSATTN